MKDGRVKCNHAAQVCRVVDFCCQYLEREVSEDNYLYLQELALLYSLERLDAFIDRFVLARFATLSLTPDFLSNTPPHKLASYLSSGQVNNPPRSGCVATARFFSTSGVLQEAAPLSVLRSSTAASRSSSRPPCGGSPRPRSGWPTPRGSSRTSASP